MKDGATRNETSVLFIQDRFMLGGIENLEIKVANFLADLGHEVIIAHRSGDSVSSFSPRVTLLPHEGYPDFLNRAGDIRFKHERVVLASLHPAAALVMLILSCRLKPHQKIGLFHWVSHSRAFFFSSRSVVRSLLRRTFFLLPVDSTYMMNTETLSLHQDYWRTNLSKYKVLRILGREPTAAHQARAEGAAKIVSVGRLVSFKGYNVKAPEICSELRSAGKNVTWDIWGYGPDEQKIRDEIKDHGVEDRVKLRGELPHREFDAVVSDADVFVGMGTALLEAAKTGTPSIVALENGAADGYGFLSDAPGDGVGDRIVGHPATPLSETISELLRLPVSERRRLGERCAKAARERESSIHEFSDAILRSTSRSEYSFRERIILSIGEAYIRFKGSARKRKPSLPL